MEIRHATLADIERFNLRQDDINEMMLFGAPNGRDGLLMTFNMSDLCWCGENKGNIFCVAGCAKDVKGGRLWILIADGVQNLPLSFFKESRKYVKLMLDKYGYLENYALSHKKFVLDWSRWLGFTVDSPIPYGPNGELFCKVHIGG